MRSEFPARPRVPSACVSGDKVLEVIPSIRVGGVDTLERGYTDVVVVVVTTARRWYGYCVQKWVDSIGRAETE